MELTRAKQIAGSILDYLAPYCEQIAIAGSVRRRKPDVGDIEIVVEPKMNNAQIGMFTGVDFPDEPAPKVSALTREFVATLGVIKKDGERYKQITMPEGINLDLFVVLPPAQWGVIFTIRTGPADFSHWLVTPKRQGGALPANLRVKDGALWNGDELIPTPYETDFFDAIGLEWIDPELRAARWNK